MRRIVRTPREMARSLRLLARRRPRHAEDYLRGHATEWPALAEASPSDAADILEAIDEDLAGGLIANLDPGRAAELLEELRDDLAADIIEELDTENAARLLQEMPPDAAADVLAAVEDDTIVQGLLESMEIESAGEIRELLAFGPETAGGLMTTDIAALPIGMTVGEAVERIRGLHEELEDLSYVYIVDAGGRLIGVVSFRDLVFRRPGDGLDEAMLRSPISVTTATDREEIAELVQRYHLFGLPVVDDEGRLVGMVTTDAVIEAIQEEASEDFAVAVGTRAEDSVYVPITQSIRHRLPWIAIDIVMSALVVWSVTRFEDVLTTFVVLAALMPLVARIGGDSGAQSLAVVIRGLATDGIPGSDVRRVLAREMSVGIVNGLVIAILAGGLGYGLQMLRDGPDPMKVGLAMALAAWANLILAGLAGAAIPLTLRKLGFDPALGSNLFLTTLTDLLGFAGFLAVATALL
jgi:magnesium transporter